MKSSDYAELPAASNITHEHLTACINTIIAHEDLGRPFRILDMGCGDGELLSYLMRILPILKPDFPFEMYGFDVSDSGVQGEGFFAQTIEKLEKVAPDIVWRDRLSIIGSRDEWPYEDGFFDLVVSNQVFEHVRDHQHLLRQLHRTLRDDGISLHLFPLGDNFMEGHIHIPFAHWIKSHGLLKAYIKFMSRFGFGSFKSHRDKYSMSMDYYSEEHADYIYFMTNYLNSKKVLSLCKDADLRADFRYTKQFYFRKVRSVFRMSNGFNYSMPSPFRDAVMFLFFKRIASVTLFIQKKQIYSRSH